MTDHTPTLRVAILMGSKNDRNVMRHAAIVLRDLGIGYEWKVLSAHRMPEKLEPYAKAARGRGINVIIAGAGGAAHLPGMIASFNKLIPVLGVPVSSTSNNVNDLAALLSIAPMPGGSPVGTMAIGKAGAKSAAVMAAQILALTDQQLTDRLAGWQAKEKAAVESDVDMQLEEGETE